MPLLGRLAALSSVLLPTVIAGFDAASSDNVAAYWGQNSFGKADGPLVQQRLLYYCENSDIDIIPIAFLLGIKTPRVNFANQEAGCQPIAGSGLIYCPDIESDIKACQTKYGKRVLLSLGGDSYTEGGFSSTAEAQDNAEKVWAMFGPSSAATGPRPFGSAVVDGYDFNFESRTDNLVPFAQRLRQLADKAPQSMLFTAAPQCPYPDAAVGELLASSVKMDAVFVQFYNNYCGLTSFVSGTASQTNFNFDTWDKWAKKSANPNVKVMIGAPGNVGGAGSGYISASKLQAVTDYASQYSSFGGVMMWDVSQIYSNPGFLSTIRTALVAILDSVSVVPNPIVVKPVATSPPTVAAPTPGASTPTPTIIPGSTEDPIWIIDVPTTPTKHDPVASSPAQDNSGIKAGGGSIPTLVAPAPPASGVLVEQWNQCGGIGYTGQTQCVAGLVCTKGGSEWWYSCKTPGALWKA